MFKALALTCGAILAFYTALLWFAGQVIGWLMPA